MKTLRFPVAAALIAAQTIDLSPPSNPRFIQQPWRDHDPFFLGRHHGRSNPKAKGQKAAKRARKITRQRRKS